MSTPDIPARTDQTTEHRRVITTGDPVAELWLSRPGIKRVFAPCPHDQAVNRILDVIPALESDFRVQVVLGVPDTGYRWYGVEERVRALGGLVIPWTQAVRTRFDLVIAACNWGIAELDGPVVLMPHGAGSLRSRVGHDGGSGGHGLHPGELMRGDRVIPAALALATDDEVVALARSCPEAIPRSIVAGDPSFDRILAGVPYRGAYRNALGARPGQRVVVATTSWSEHSLFGNDPLVFSRLVEALPTEDYLVVAVLHPFIWRGYGRRQVLAWLAAARARGLVVLPPEEGWRAALAAADVVVGDHGSVLQYAAAIGVPTLMNTGSLVDVRPGSTADVVSRVASPLRLDRSLQAQVERALAVRANEPDPEVVGLITTRPGAALGILRRTFYGLMGLSEPTHGVPVSPAPRPRPIR